MDDGIPRKVSQQVREELVAIYAAMTVLFVIFFGFIMPRPEGMGVEGPLALLVMWLGFCAVVVRICPEWMGRHIEKLHRNGVRRRAKVALRLPLSSLFSGGIVLRIDENGGRSRLRWAFALPEQVAGLQRGAHVCVVEVPHRRGMQLGRIVRCLELTASDRGGSAPSKEE